jgi:hypothetical protein
MVYCAAHPNNICDSSRRIKNAKDRQFRHGANAKEARKGR